MTVTWSLLTPQKFEARATFVPQDPIGAPSGLGQIATQLGLAAPRGTTNSPQFYVELLLSREIMRDVLTTDYNVAGNPAFRGTLIEFFRIRRPDTTDAVLRGLEKLSRGLDVESDRTTGMVTLSVRTEMPTLSVAVAGRFLDLLNDYNLKRRQSQARAEREFTGQQLDEAQRALREAEEAVASFLQRNRDYTNSPLLRAAFDRLNRGLQLRQGLYLSLNQNFQTARIEEVRNTPVITVIERPETLVEPVRRHVARNALTALLLGAVLAVGLAFVGEFVRNSARGDVPDYGQFISLRREAFGRLRRRSGKHRPT